MKLFVCICFLEFFGLFLFNGHCCCCWFFLLFYCYCKVHFESWSECCFFFFDLMELCACDVSHGCKHNTDWILTGNWQLEDAQREHDGGIGSSGSGSGSDSDVGSDENGDAKRTSTMPLPLPTKTTMTSKFELTRPQYEACETSERQTKANTRPHVGTTDSMTEIFDRRTHRQAGRRTNRETDKHSLRWPPDERPVSNESERVLLPLP